MKSLKTVLSVGVLSLLIATPAFSAPDISLVMDSKKVNVTKEGKETYADASSAVPGDTLLYTIKVSNKGDKAAYEVESEGNIPSNTVYVPEKASSDLYKMEFSLDKGATYSSEPKITVTEKGKTIVKKAPVEMYNKIKWIVKSVAPSKTILLNYKVKVKK